MNWEAIKVEISCSNVIQRDNLSFAKALDKDMMDIAKENDVTVSKRASQSTRQGHDGHRQGERHYFTVSKYRCRLCEGTRQEHDDGHRQRKR